MYKVVLDKKVLKDLRRIDKKEQLKIIDTIENKLANDPFVGKKLAENLSEYYKYRVGNYRIIYLLYQKRIEIEIVKIGDRKNIYRSK